MSAPGYAKAFVFRVYGAEWLLTERLGPTDALEGWALLERRAPHLCIWTEAFKRDGRWELEEDGRRDVVNYVSEKAAADLEQYLNAYEPPLMVLAARP